MQNHQGKTVVIGAMHGVAKHTPGPWTVEDIGTDCLFIKGNVPQEGANAELRDYYSNIATVTQRGPHPRYGGGIERATTLANACLIAAAPELLEALRKLADAYERLKPPGYPLSDPEKQARAVIAKATGSTP